MGLLSLFIHITWKVTALRLRAARRVDVREYWFRSHYFLHAVTEGKKHLASAYSWLLRGYIKFPNKEKQTDGHVRCIIPFRYAGEGRPTCSTSQRARSSVHSRWNKPINSNLVQASQRESGRACGTTRKPPRPPPRAIPSYTGPDESITGTNTFKQKCTVSLSALTWTL
jgi:hypothetical protein